VHSEGINQIFGCPNGFTILLAAQLASSGMGKSMMKKKATLLVIVLFTLASLNACNAHDFNKTETVKSVELSAQDNAASQGKASAVETKQLERQVANARIVDLTNLGGLSSIIKRLAEDRVVYVGETHDRFSHHLLQLEVIRQFHQLSPKMAIGLEFFQQPFQSALDDYIAGRSTEAEMLLSTEWYDRWRFDYRLYRPVMNYAREHKIPLVALNVPRELIERVSAVGLAGLDENERGQLPEQMDSDDERYRERIMSVYQSHPKSEASSFERFLEVQLAWDEGMAEQIVRYLQANSASSMVVLTGTGHLMHGTGIPNRVNRRMSIKSHILLPADSTVLNPDIADFLVFVDQVELPEAGLMGVMLDDRGTAVRISGVVPESAAARAGVLEGDVIQRLNGAEVRSVADIKIGMLDKSPGELVLLQLLRKRLVMGEEILQLELKLGGK